MADETTVEYHKEYEVLEDLGQGACGKTMLVLDKTINEQYVVKKFSPTHSRPDLWGELFNRFVKEVKILHKLAADSVVRIFSNAIDVEKQEGLIVMEYVQGKTINQYVSGNPDSIEDLFEQSIQAFKYLTEVNVLHRDIRNENIMVDEDGNIKIIDFGFGKSYESPESLEEYSALEVARNHRPLDISYNVATEIYYLGWLFRELMDEDAFNNFKYRIIINRMIAEAPEQRFKTFAEVNYEMNKQSFEQEDLTENQIGIYQAFALQLSRMLIVVFPMVEYYDDISLVEINLEEAYKAAQYEKIFPHGNTVIRCFVTGDTFDCDYKYPMEVKVFHDFLMLYASSADKIKRNLLAHICQRLDSKKPY